MKHNVVNKIREELNIDIHKYSDNNIFSSIRNLVFIQKQALGRILGWSFLCFLLYVVSFFMIDLSVWGFFIYGFFGFILFISIGIGLGLISLLKRVKKDLLSITQQSTVLLERIYSDVANAHDSERLRHPLTLIFEAVLRGIVQPKISSGIGSSMFRKIIDGAVGRSIPMLLENFKAVETKFNVPSKLNAVSGRSMNRIDKSKTIINAYLLKIDNIINESLSFVSIPLKAATFMLTLILGLFIWIMN